MPCGRSGRRPSGNPFFVKQLVRHLEEVGRGARLRDDGLGVPEGVRDVIARRVARLPAHAGRVLARRGADRPRLRLELLERVADLPEDELLDVLDAARARRAAGGGAEHARPLLVRPRAAAHDARGRAVRDPAGAAAPAHRRGDRAAPRRPAGSLARRARAAFRRRRAAQEVDRAVDYAARAAAQATGRLAYDEAVRLLARGGRACAGTTSPSTRRSSRGSRRAWPPPRRTRAGGRPRARASPAPPRPRGPPTPATRSPAPRSGTPAAPGSSTAARTPRASRCSRRRSSACRRATRGCGRRSSRGSPCSATYTPAGLVRARC